MTIAPMRQHLLQITAATRVGQELCPRSMPRAWMSAPVASETRRPLRASREIRACSAAGPESGGDQQRTELIAVQPDGVRLIV